MEEGIQNYYTTPSKGSVPLSRAPLHSNLKDRYGLSHLEGACHPRNAGSGPQSWCLQRLLSDEVSWSPPLPPGSSCSGFLADQGPLSLHCYLWDSLPMGQWQVERTCLQISWKNLMSETPSSSHDTHPGQGRVSQAFKASRAHRQE